MSSQSSTETKFLCFNGDGVELLNKLLGKDLFKLVLEYGKWAKPTFIYGLEKEIDSRYSPHSFVCPQYTQNGLYLDLKMSIYDEKGEGDGELSFPQWWWNEVFEGYKSISGKNIGKIPKWNERLKSFGYWSSSGEFKKVLEKNLEK